MNKNILVILIGVLLSANIIYGAPENKIKFDSKTYSLSNPESKTNRYIYLLKNENIENWHTQIYKEYLKTVQNPTEAAAELAYQIQKENPKAVVLVYPEVATIGYITFPKSKKFYEYNTVVFKTIDNELTKLGYAKRFYANSNGSESNARTAAILFAQKNNKKYMELINKLDNNK